MRPDTIDPRRSAADCARAADALHREVGAVYDTLERHLAAAAWQDAAALVPRLIALEAELRPLAAAHSREGWLRRPMPQARASAWRRRWASTFRCCGRTSRTASAASPVFQNMVMPLHLMWCEKEELFIPG
jgi:hypothetical protein